MKYLQFLFLAIVAIGAISCSVSGPESITLPNGTVISTAEKSALDALSDKANDIFTARLGAVRARDIASGGSPETTEDENFAVMEDLKALLRSEFGADAEKYIVEGEFGEESVTSEPSAALVRGFYVTDGQDAIYLYVLYMEAKYCILPWGSWNWAYSEHRARYINKPEDRLAWYTDDVYAIRSMIRDEVNPSGVSVLKNQTSSATATGKPKYGFFPKIGNIVSEHEAWDENITGGHVFRRYYWAMP